MDWPKLVKSGWPKRGIGQNRSLPFPDHPVGGGLISKGKSAHRFDLFARGEWLQLLEMSEQCDVDAARARRRCIWSLEFPELSVGAFGICETGIGGCRSGSEFSGDYVGFFRPFQVTESCPILGWKIREESPFRQKRSSEQRRFIKHDNGAPLITRRILNLCIFSS